MKLNSKEKISVRGAGDVWGATDISGILGITDTRLRQLIKNGVLPGAVGRNQYDLFSTVHSYITFLRGRTLGDAAKGGAGSVSLASERTRLMGAQADVQEMKLKEMRGELLPAAWVLEMSGALVGAAKTKVLGIHSKLRGRFPHLEKQVADAVEKLSREALEELGTDGLHPDIRSHILEAVPPVDASAEPDKQSVGG